MIWTLLLSMPLLVGSPVVGGPDVDGRAVDPPAAEDAMAPGLTATSTGAALVWLETQSGSAETDRESNLRLRFSAFEAQEGWSTPVTITEGRSFFANWADTPSVTEIADGSLLAHWLERTGDEPYAYGVMLARSNDGGRTWQVLGAPHDDGTPTEHGFVSYAPLRHSAWTFWLDGRAMAGDAADAADDHGHGSGDMALRAALVSDAIADSRVLDHRVCECCSTDAAMTKRGPVVVYRDRSDAEIRDIFITRREGLSWSTPAAVHHDGWQILACPVNGPAIAADDDLVAVAWFTGAIGQGAVLVAFSRDAGVHFDEAIIIDDDWSAGRVDVILAGDGSAIVSWMDEREGRGSIMLCRVDPEDGAGPRQAIAEVSTARSSGFPRMARLGEAVLVVWTEVGDAAQRLRATLIDLDDLPAGEGKSSRAREPEKLEEREGLRDQLCELVRWQVIPAHGFGRYPALRGR